MKCVDPPTRWIDQLMNWIANPKKWNAELMRLTEWIENSDTDKKCFFNFFALPLNQYSEGDLFDTLLTVLLK
jgi:hypothetical protein